MRLPPRYRNRWVYGVTAGASAFAFISVWGGGLDFSTTGLGFELGLTLSAALVALCAWPRHSRSKGRMAFAAIIVVIFSFLAFIPVGMIVSALLDGSLVEPATWEEAFTLLPASLLALIYGTLVTLGLPYGVAILVSFLFADDPPPQ